MKARWVDTAGRRGVHMAKRNVIGYLQSLDPLLLQPQYPVFADGVRIGRDSEQCQVILSRDFVSRRHCAVLPDQDGVVLNDMDSSNGLFVNGQRVKHQFLQDGDVIGLGKSDARHFMFSTKPAARQREFDLPPMPSYRIGRSVNADLPLMSDPVVSSRHAILRVVSGRLTIEDTDSASGTFVNGAPIRRTEITASDRVTIGAAELHFNYTERGLHVAMQSTHNRLDLRASNISRAHKGRTILRNVSLAIHPGEFVGMLGPSGAGKSTLLTALCGFQPASSGDVLLNGHSLYRGFDLYRNSIGYVPQDDIIHRDLTVEKSLVYTAQLRLPRDNSASQIDQNVNSVIETLGLDHVRANPVARLSGGQRKRVSVGCELLTKPSILFLDEPTSGLDPSTEEKLMKHFGQMAEQGQTVVVTTHILYNLDLLDLVIILARGRLVYFGPVAELCTFFSTPERTVDRPLDVFDTLEPDAHGDSSLLEKRAEMFEKKYLESPLHTEYVVERGGEKGTQSSIPSISPSPERETQPKPPAIRRLRRAVGGFFDARQLLILLRRVFDLKMSAMGRLMVPLITPILLAVLTATIELGDADQKARERQAFERDPNNAQAIALLHKLDPPIEISEMKYEGIANFPVPLSIPLIMVMTAVFLGTLSACLEISGERSVYLRERSVNLKIHLYLLAKLPFLFILALIQSFVYVLLASVLLGLPTGQILGLVFIVAAVAWVSCLIGLFISSLDPTAGQNSVVLAVVAVLPQLVLAGAQGPAFYRDMSTPAKALASALPARWGFELMLNVLYQTPEWARKYITGAELGRMGFRFDDGVFSTNAAALALIGVCFFVATCISLKRYDKL